MKNSAQQKKKTAPVRRPDRKKDLLSDFFACTVGSVLFAFSIMYFTAPHQIAPGGITGLAVMLRELFGLSIGITTLVLNLPLVILGWIFLGHPFVLRSAYCIAVNSLFVDVVFRNISPFQSENTLLAALFGGVAMGIGLGMIFLRDASTGGTDIASRLLQLKYPFISMGKMMLLIDAVVVALSILVFRSTEAALYAIICIFVSSKLIDTLLYGQYVSKQLLIITGHPEDCKAALLQTMPRGITVLHGEGGYTKKEKKILLCVVRRSEFYTVKQTVKRVDPNAFLIVSDVSEVLGEGFRTNNAV